MMAATPIPNPEKKETNMAKSTKTPAKKEATENAAQNASMIAKAAAARLAKQAAMNDAKKADTKAVKAKAISTDVPPRETVNTVPATPAVLETAVTEPATLEAPPAKPKKPKPAKAEMAKKMSALDAAAKVLADSGEPMNTKAMIEAMAAKKLWSSPGGKTPAATLYSAILREIGVKGKESRFRKTDKGLFAAVK
jgi:hypothetical protein